MTAVWQQVFALDARYNANRAPNHPNFRTLYIRRRNQLLKESFQGENTPFRKQYLKTRAVILQQRYGHNGGSVSDQVSVKSRSIRSASRISDNTDASRPPPDVSNASLVPTKQANASRAIVGGTTISENYAFVGVHHIFDQHTASVGVVKFAHNDRSRLLCASKDQTVSICNVTNTPPTVEVVLRGHDGAITSCDWSLNNDLVLTSSLDTTLRLWHAGSGRCLRVVQDPGGSEILSCVFQPANNNMVIVGNARGSVSVLNVSTGIYPKGGSHKPGGRIISLACDASGSCVWAGSDKGVVTSYNFEPETGRLHKRKRLTVFENCAITCISWRAWISREARDPSLLVSCAANCVCLYRVVDVEGGLQLRKKFATRHTSELLRSTFCPIMSFRQGACIVTGSEDSCVYFLDIEKEPKAAVVNKLQGHACPVLGVSFNYDESLLASSDLQGLVIVWKRATTEGRS